MWKMITVAMVAGMVLALTPPTAAFHGSPYVLNGTAEFGPTHAIWNARLEWAGFGGGFRVTLTSPVNGLNLPAHSIPGGEAVPVAAWVSAGACTHPNELLEVVSPYVGRDTQSMGQVLNVRGVQENCLLNGGRYMHVTGTYLTVWNLDVSVGTPYGTQWENL